MWGTLGSVDGYGKYPLMMAGNVRVYDVPTDLIFYEQRRMRNRLCYQLDRSWGYVVLANYIKPECVRWCYVSS